jgi:hypothetical protein
MLAAVLATGYAWWRWSANKNEVRARAVDAGGDPDEAWRIHKIANTNAMIATPIIVTALAAAAFWFWGVKQAQSDSQQAAAEQAWLDTFVDKHRQNWNDDCNAIFFHDGNTTGVLYPSGSSQPLTVQWCQAQWQAPVVPSEYSRSEYAQPGSTPPFASEAVFLGPNAPGYAMCVTPNENDGYGCFDWDMVRGGPPPEFQ